MDTQILSCHERTFILKKQLNDVNNNVAILVPDRWTFIHFITCIIFL